MSLKFNSMHRRRQAVHECTRNFGNDKRGSKLGNIKQTGVFNVSWAKGIAEHGNYVSSFSPASPSPQKI